MYHLFYLAKSNTEVFKITRHVCQKCSKFDSSVNSIWVHTSLPVWPDSAIFESSCWPNLILKLPKYLANSLATFKNSIFTINCCGYFLGNFETIWATVLPNIWSHCSLQCLRSLWLDFLRCINSSEEKSFYFPAKIVEFKLHLMCRNFSNNLRCILNFGALGRVTLLNWQILTDHVLSV